MDRSRSNINGHKQNKWRFYHTEFLGHSVSFLLCRMNGYGNREEKTSSARRCGPHVDDSMTWLALNKVRHAIVYLGAAAGGGTDRI
jgi:hypothetical protein